MANKTLGIRAVLKCVLKAWNPCFPNNTIHKALQFVSRNYDFNFLENPTMLL